MSGPVVASHSLGSVELKDHWVRVLGVRVVGLRKAHTEMLLSLSELPMCPHLAARPSAAATTARDRLAEEHQDTIPGR